MISRRTRPYRMSARADAAAQTHQRILAAAIALFSDRAYDDVGLADVAHAAGVTVQTVLRRFGSKDGLGEAAAALATDGVRAARLGTPPGDVAAAMRNLAEHYEAWGDRSLRFLSQELRTPAMRKVTDAGRALHHAWVEQAFQPWLQAARGAARTRLRARLIAATDVYVWKIMRRDLGLDPAATALAMRELVVALLD